MQLANPFIPNFRPRFTNDRRLSRSVIRNPCTVHLTSDHNKSLLSARHSPRYSSKTRTFPLHQNPASTSTIYDQNGRTGDIVYSNNLRVPPSLRSTRYAPQARTRVTGSFLNRMCLRTQSVPSLRSVPRGATSLQTRRLRDGEASACSSDE